MSIEHLMEIIEKYEGDDACANSFLAAQIHAAGYRHVPDEVDVDYVMLRDFSCLEPKEDGGDMIMFDQHKAELLKHEWLKPVQL